MIPGQAPRVVILIPVFNDWDCVSLLLPLLDEAAGLTAADVSILLVDDGSTRNLPSDLVFTKDHVRRIDVLHLMRNLGHQRAIAIGLYHVYRHIACDKVIVMDADGQDLPIQVPTLIEASNRHPKRVVFAARTKRLERPVFRLFYHLYRITHRVLTGIPVRIGNFSVLPWDALERLVVVSDLWSHYAAAVVRSRLEYETLPLPRGRRLAGDTRMNFWALLIHGLSAICVFGDIASARVLAAAVAGTLLIATTALAAITVHWTGGWQIPEWGVYLWAGMLFLCVQAMLLAGILSFTIIASRSNMSFIALRDGRYVVRSVSQLMPRSEASFEEASRPMARP